jgi:hypothetical protein
MKDRINRFLLLLQRVQKWVNSSKPQLQQILGLQSVRQGISILIKLETKERVDDESANEEVFSQ